MKQVRILELNQKYCTSSCFLAARRRRLCSKQAMLPGSVVHQMVGSLTVAYQMWMVC